MKERKNEGMEWNEMKCVLRVGGRGSVVISWWWWWVGYHFEICNVPYSDLDRISIRKEGSNFNNKLQHKRTE